MSSTTSPTVSRRWLALEMRRLRKERRLSQSAVAKALGCQVPKVSLMETGQRPLQDADLKTLLELFDVPETDRQPYVDQLENAQERGWWELYEDEIVPDWYRDFIGLEQGASQIRAYQSAVVHGLLQTPKYARALLADAFAGISGERVTRMVRIRQRRQKVLAGGPDAPRLAVVLDEAALRHVVGTREVMREQLEHVAATCRTTERLTVQVVPFDRGGAVAAAHGPFTVFNFELSPDLDLVYKEHRSGADFHDTLVDIDHHSLMFEGLVDLALSPDESVEMLREVARSYQGS